MHFKITFEINMISVSSVDTDISSEINYEVNGKFIIVAQKRSAVDIIHDPIYHNENCEDFL